MHAQVIVVALIGKHLYRTTEWTSQSRALGRDLCGKRHGPKLVHTVSEEAMHE